MELKNAVAVCLISLFSATLVLLIARSLDLQAASRLEPQLAKIAEELEAIRSRGGFAAASGEDSPSPVRDDALIVYYFHGVRCPTCRAAEANAHETLKAEYVSQLENGKVTWKVLDYMTDPTAKEMAEEFGVMTASIVLVRMKDGQVETWNRLDRTLALAENKSSLSAYLQDEINGMLKTPDRETESVQLIDVPEVTLPGGQTDALPTPTNPAEIPLPE